MIDQECIGKAAGIVWRHLHDQGPGGVSLASLKKVSGLRADQAVAAVGWLAREGKLEFENGARSVVRLADTELVG